MTVVKSEQFEIDYKNVTDQDGPLWQIAQWANRLGLEKKRVTDMKISGKFGVGITVRFNLAD